MPFVQMYSVLQVMETIGKMLPVSLNSSAVYSGGRSTVCLLAIIATIGSCMYVCTCVCVYMYVCMSRAHDKTGEGRACNFHSILYVRAEYFMRTINRHFQ